MWIDIAAIVFACTAVNHLGLIAAIERIMRHRLPVVNCPKCLTFWSTLTYCLVYCDDIATIPFILALSFLAAYAAVWLQLLMYSVDTIYNRIYDMLSKNNPEENDGDDEGS